MAQQAGPAQQDAARIQSIQTVHQLRREARDEISRLIQFLDASDEYVTTEFEDDDEREEGGDSEPSLGLRIPMISPGYTDLISPRIPR